MADLALILRAARLAVARCPWRRVPGWTRADALQEARLLALRADRAWNGRGDRAAFVASRTRLRLLELVRRESRHRCSDLVRRLATAAPIAGPMLADHAYADAFGYDATDAGAELASARRALARHLRRLRRAGRRRDALVLLANYRAEPRRRLAERWGVSEARVSQIHQAAVRGARLALGERALAA